MLRNKALLIFIFWILFLNVNGQFVVTQKRGCYPFTVNITNNTSISFTYYFYDSVNQPSTFETNTYTYTYSTPGMYVIKQFGTDGTYKLLDTDTVYVLDQNHNAEFSVDLCANFVVRVNITDTIYDLFDIDYGDGNVVTVPKGVQTHTYASSATRTISVTGKYTECPGKTGSKTITPIQTLLAPDVSDITVNSQTASSSIVLRYTPLVDRDYTIYRKIGAGSFIAVDTIRYSTTSSITNYTVSNLNTAMLQYSFQIRNIDMCANPPSLPSVTLHSILVNPIAQNGYNDVGWQTQGSFGSYMFRRDNDLFTPVSSSPYLDYNVVCPNSYCYRLEGTYATVNALGQPHRSYSGSSCVTATLTQTLPTVSINSGFDNEQVVARWDVPASVGTYTLNLIDATPTTNSLTTNQYSESSWEHCYSVFYSDNCGNTSSVSNTTCPMVMNLTKTDETVFLTWTAYTGYANTGLASYEVEVLGSAGNILYTQNVGSALAYQEIPNPNYSFFRYRIKAVSNGAENMVSYSNVIDVDLSPQLHMPNTFTPNGDGVNDSFVPKGKYFTNFKLTVFNKWGEVIFVTDDAISGWDGTYRNEPVSLDTYSYFVQAESNEGQKISKRGVVTVLR